MLIFVIGNRLSQICAAYMVGVSPSGGAALPHEILEVCLPPVRAGGPPMGCGGQGSRGPRASGATPVHSECNPGASQVIGGASGT